VIVNARAMAVIVEPQPPWLQAAIADDQVLEMQDESDR